MQNQNKTEKNTEKLDASKMSGAEILEAVGVAEPLTESLVHTNQKQVKVKTVSHAASSRNTEVPSLRRTPAASETRQAETTKTPVTDTEIQDKIAAIQKKKMDKIKIALASVNTESREIPLAMPPKQPKTENVSRTKKVKVKKASEATPKMTAVSAVPLSPKTTAKSAKPRQPNPQPQTPPQPKQTKSSSKAKKRHRKTARTGAIIGVSAAGCLILAYFVIALNYQNKFLPNTYINSLAVSGMTTDEAHDALLDEKELKDLTLVTPDGEEIIFSAEDFKAAYVIDTSALDEAASEGNFNWVSKLFNPSEYAVKYEYTYSADDLRNLILSYDWGDTPSENAKIIRDEETGEFVIQPETIGNQLDADKLVNYVISQLESGNSTIYMEDSGCYDNYLAKITQEDLKDDLEVYNRFANCSISFDFGDTKKTVDSDMIISWLLTKEDGSYVTTSGHSIPLDVSAVSAFVVEMAQETDTYGSDLTFTAYVDGEITIPWTDASCYGWQIDRTATTEQLLSLIETGDPVVVEPIYTSWGTGYVREGDGIGNTYIEVDISEQHFWYFRDGELLMDYDFVSGTETNASRRTPRGICKIVGHTQGITLGTYAVQGYEQWVDYWIPFNYLGCGFHDLSRSAYGGTIYMYNGSHGCLNMRHSEVAELYAEIEDGIPVLVHD